MRCATPVAALCGVLGVLGSLGSGPSVVTRHMVCHMVFEGPYKWSNQEQKSPRPFLQATTHVWLKSQGLKAALRGHPRASANSHSSTSVPSIANPSNPTPPLLITSTTPQTLWASRNAPGERRTKTIMLVF
ncbi:hypothetical protein E4U22_004271 [Claviceps purpurea]|nr:hypothetical protein E4U22_004271 [Claviceps purpurea]